MSERIPILLAGVLLVSSSLTGCGDADGAAIGGAAPARETIEAPPIDFGSLDSRRERTQPSTETNQRGIVGPASSPDGGVTASPSESAAGADPGLPALDDPADYDASLTASVETAVANAIERARTASRGRVDERNVAVSVVAVDATSGRVLVRRLSEVPLVPASNLKLLTVAAALVTLGADGAFVTRFESNAPTEGGVLQGDLVVRAGGDPLHVREGDGSLDAWVEPLAQALLDGGIRRIEGALVLDEGGWLEPGPGPKWPAPDQHWRDYCGLAGGFSANGGCYRTTVTPGRAGERASVVLRPRHHGLTRKGSVTTTGSRVAVNVGANRGGVTVRGKIRSDSKPYVAEFSHPDPVDLFGHVIVGGLRDRGIQVDGGFVRAREVELKDARLLHVMRTPITSVLEAVLLDSNNPVADQLFLAAGAAKGGDGTRAAGARAVTDALRSLGVDTRTLVQVDGSGLSKANRVTAEQFAALVSAVVHRGGAMREAIMGALPVAGRTGKLAGRMRGTAAEGRVRAKTGWVKGASGLSGVAQTPGGGEVVFSILVGYPPVDGLNTSAWKPMQDEICVALAEWSPGPPSQGADR